MGLFDQLKNQVTSSIKREVSKTVNEVAKDAANAVGKGRNHSETFVFQELPKNLAELKALPEASLDTPFKTTAICIAALCRFKEDPEAVWEMIEFLNGPEDLNPSNKSTITERLTGKEYKTFSFFKGATPENAYTPSKPYTITVSENPYSFDNENWAVLYVTSGGADNPRPVKLRKKPSTNQWFINDLQCLSDIRIPTEQDKWA